MMESDREQLDRFWRENRELYQKDKEEHTRKEAVLLKKLSDNGSAYATVELFHNSDRFYLTDGEKQLYHERICFMYENDPKAFDWRMLYFVGMGVAGERYGKQVEVDEDAIREAIEWMIRSISEGGLNCLGTILDLYKKYIKGSDDESFKWCVWGLKQPTLLSFNRFIDPTYAIGYPIKRLIEMAVNGHAPSQYYLGILYVKGDVVKVSDEKAQEWFARSAGNGYERAIRVMDEYGRDGNFLTLLTREYLEPDDFGTESMPEIQFESRNGYHGL